MRWNGATGAGVACAAIVAGAQLSSVAGCVMPQVAATPASSLTSAEAARTPPAAPSLFKLKPEWTGPCARADVVDVNLGHSREAFVNAAYCQITGQKAPEATVAEWAARLRQNPKTRRVDVVRSLALAEKRTLKLRYSDPWESQPDLGAPPDRKNPRDVGAVFMFFFNCPGGVNCGMDWANTHAVGMDAPSPLLGVERGQSAVYSPSEQGFWRRELLDAKYAGLQFLLLNTYGPDIEDGKLAPLARALDALDAPVKIALFDDTWTWGQPYFREFWKQKPDLAKTEKAANLLYEAKWKPFFSQIDKKHWYRFQGRPFIYFYNSGTLEPRERSASVLAKMKERFKTEFGEEPFVAVDGAYFADQDMPRVADSRFNWMTFNSPDKRSRSRLNGHVVDHAMVKWDAVGRDRPGEIATERDRIIKDSALLEKVLADSSDADILVLATWNDLGEGTGVNRNYDYYADGHWLAPDHFMRLIRDSQSAPRR
ncbi:MAG TPA: DUF5010 domain-containing protein [Polyangiaceae bacterium]